MFNKKGPRDTTRKTEAGPALIFLPPCIYSYYIIKIRFKSFIPI